MLIGTAVCGKPHVRWCERAGEIKPSPLYSICKKTTLRTQFFYPSAYPFPTILETTNPNSYKEV